MAKSTALGGCLDLEVEHSPHISFDFVYHFRVYLVITMSLSQQLLSIITFTNMTLRRSRGATCRICHSLTQFHHQREGCMDFVLGTEIFMYLGGNCVGLVSFFGRWVR